MPNAGSENGRDPFRKTENVKRIVTYGTFDLFHIGHLRILERARDMGDQLFVGVSSDEFNAIKGKNSFFSYNNRAAIISSLRCVDHVFPEYSWDQKPSDFQKYKANVFVMGSDWTGKFDELSNLIQVHYLPRTEGISSSDIKKQLQKIDDKSLDSVKSAISLALNMLNEIR